MSTMRKQLHNKESDQDERIEQVRVTFSLEKSIKDLSLTVPSEPIAIPSSLRRKGLSAIINHLLDRKTSNKSNDNDDDEESDADDDDDDNDESSKLPFVTFDFIICGKLLRTGVETAARRYGLSLEESIPITYFPAQEAPHDDGQSEELPDWISCLSYTDQNLCSAGYDGTIRIHQTLSERQSEKHHLLQTKAVVQAHHGPIKCLASCLLSDSQLLIASGSLDQSLVTHVFNTSSSTSEFEQHAQYKEGHTSSIGCLHINPKTHFLVSGDWDGGLCVWNTQATSSTISRPHDEAPGPSKKSKSLTGKAAASQSIIPPSAVIPSAHSSQISGVAWLLHQDQVVTSSWDHSVKVWSIESQDCLLTLNGSRVISCMDLSPLSQVVVATGHPDCTIRLWDIRTGTDANDKNAGSLITDTTLQPSHKAWVSSVKWSPTNPYILSSTSHDGTLKIWDIRSSLPLHSIRTMPKSKKVKNLCSVYGKNVIYLAGTDCIVKQFAC